jgi:hypothetical protein
MRANVKLLALLACLVPAGLCAQRIQVGVNFQYLILKQVKIDSEYIIPEESYNFYYIRDNRWKFFGAGQSIVIGTVIQADYKKLYLGMEPGFELNTYNYNVFYPTQPGHEEKVTFQTLFFQINAPLYVGYQFKTSAIVRYSVFAGAGPVIPYHIEFYIKENMLSDGPSPADRYWIRDMNGILYNEKSYVNGLAGFGVHVASLLKADVRYVHRFSSPGLMYPVKYNTVGVSLTYYLPMNLFKQKIYYEQ